MEKATHTIVAFATKHIVVILILLGVIVRVVGFPSVPYGINQDELVSAYSAFTLIHEGVEPYGNPYPVNLLSWRSGSAILPAIVMMPSVWLFGITPFSIRIPFLLIGCCTLPLFYYFLRRLTDERTARVGLFLLVIAPWHIMASRWSLDGFLVPPLMLLGCHLFLRWLDGNSWHLTAAAAAFALSFYAYGPALAVVPPLLLVLIHLAIVRKGCTWKTMIGPGVALGMVSAPMVLYVLINTNLVDWGTIHLGPITIPKTPDPSRFSTEMIFHAPNIAAAARENLNTFLRLLVTQDDGLVYNALPRYGLIYGPGMLLAGWGVILLLFKMRKESGSLSMVPLGWFAGCLVLAPLLTLNINRMSAIMLPIIVFESIGLAWCSRLPGLFRCIVGYLTLWFLAFNYAYFVEFAPSMAGSFQGDLLSAIRSTVHRVPAGEICITNRSRLPAFYAIAAAELPSDVFRRMDSPNAAIDRFVFGLSNCSASSQGYVVTEDEFKEFHILGDRANIQRFGQFISVTPHRL